MHFLHDHMRLSFVFGRRPVGSASCQFICQLPWHSFNKFVLAKRLHEPAVFNRNHILGLGPSNLQPSLALTHTHRRTRSVDTVKEFQFQFEFLTTISVAVVELGWAGLGLYGGFSYCHSPSPSLSLSVSVSFCLVFCFCFSQFWARHGIRVRNIV